MQRFTLSFKLFASVLRLVTALALAWLLVPSAAHAERLSPVLVAQSEKLVLDQEGSELWIDGFQLRQNASANLRLRLSGSPRLVRRAQWTVRHAGGRRLALKAFGKRANFLVALRTTLKIRASLRLRDGRRVRISTTFRLSRAPQALASPTPDPFFGTPQPEATPTPGGTPVVQPTPSAAPTLTPTPTPTSTPPWPVNIEIPESAVQLSAGRYETAERRILVRPLNGPVDFIQKSISGSTQLSLLSDAEVLAQGGVPCTSSIERFCVLIVHADTDTAGEFDATITIRAHPSSDPMQVREETIIVAASILGGPTRFPDTFATISLGAIAQAKGRTVQQLLLDEMPHISPNSYVAEDRPAFEDYNLNSSSQWKNSWFNSMFDFSGIAWDAHQAGTAITRCHITLAQHYPRSGTVVFHRKNGTRFVTSIAETRTLASYGISRDVQIYRISPCLEPDMTVYPLLDGSEALTSAIVGAPLINTHFPTADNIRAISARVVGSAFTLLSGGATTIFPSVVQASAVVGDSGSPSFLYYNGQMILVSQFWTGGYGSGPYLGAQDLQVALRQLLADMPPP